MTRLLTIVWGARHLDWFERACVASLAQPGNRAALIQSVGVWDIVTDEHSTAAALRIGERLGLTPNILLADLAGPAGRILQRELGAAMARCIEDGRPLLLAPPDSVFGEGSIAAILEAGKPRGVCVAVPHVRATPALLAEPGRALSNAALVAASWRHLHRTWTEAEATREMTNTYAGGVSWRRVGDGLYAVTHRLPTIYFAQFNESDLAWWDAWNARENLCGSWDHHWPSKLVAEARQRVIGSSDAAFIAEVTPEFANIPPCTEADLGEPDKFWGNSAHIVFNRNHLAIFRAAA